MAITVTQLRAFLAVEKAGSLKGAAEQLVVTQPSVSGAVTALEKELGVKLLERRGRGVGLSASGEAFAPRAARILALLEEARTAALEASQQSHPPLKIAAVNTAGEYVVPPILREYRSREPEADLYLEVSNRAGVLSRVELRQADIGIGGSPPEGGELEGIPFLENELVVVASPDHGLASARGLAFSDLGHATWLLRENGSGTRAFTYHLLQERGIRPSVMTIGSNGAIKQSVRAGLGLGLLPRQAVSLELEMGLLTELDLREELPLRHWYALVPAQAQRRPLVEEFLGFLKEDAARRAVAESLVSDIR